MNSFILFCFNSQEDDLTTPEAEDYRMKTTCEVMNAVPASKSMLSEVAKLINIVL